LGKLAAYFLLLAGTAFLQPVLAQEASSVQNRPYISNRTFQHIVARHWPDSAAEGAGKFLPGIDRRSLFALIDEATLNGRSRQNTNGRPGEIYEYDFGRPIGIDLRGNQTSRLRVVVGYRNRVITAFPY
jgi:hypothetical protein